MMNLKVVRPGRKLRWEHLGPIANGEGKLFEDWALLMEEMSERFMIGSDARFGASQYQGRKYRKKIKRLRRILGGLDNRAAQRIAYENARCFFDW
jgi:hypothetical protein